MLFVHNTASGDRAERIGKITARDVFMSARAIFTLPFAIRRAHPDIIHIQLTPDTGFFRDIILFFLAYLSRRKIVAHTHGNVGASSALFRRSNSMQRGFRWVLRCADHVITLAPSHASEVSSYGIELSRITPIPNMALRPESERQRSPSSATTFLHLGRITREKGVEDLVDAAAIVRRHHASFRLVLAGLPAVGEYLSQLEAKIERKKLREYVAFAGYVSGSTKQKWMLESDVLVLASHSEMLPVVIFEAMAAGLPVIVTDTGCVRDYLSDGEDSLIVERRSPETLAIAMMKMINDPPLRQRMGRVNQNRYEQSFSERALVERYLGVYRSLDADHAPRRLV